MVEEFAGSYTYGGNREEDTKNTHFAYKFQHSGTLGGQWHAIPLCQWRMDNAKLAPFDKTVIHQRLPGFQHNELQRSTRPRRPRVTMAAAAGVKRAKSNSASLSGTPLVNSLQSARCGGLAILEFACHDTKMWNEA